jgi:E-phenylitaconyl-CoA hydratase
MSHTVRLAQYVPINARRDARRAGASSMSIDLEVAEHIATITINRPERMNAMDAEHYAALSAAWTRVRDDPEIRVAIITGAGEKSFSAGADLKSFVGAPPTLAELQLTQKNQLLNRGLEVWKPVVAAVKGYCLGGGTTLLLATDIRIAAEHAAFSLAEVKRGVFPANGGTHRGSASRAWRSYARTGSTMRASSGCWPAA